MCDNNNKLTSMLLKLLMIVNVISSICSFSILHTTSSNRDHHYHRVVTSFNDHEQSYRIHSNSILTNNVASNNDVESSTLNNESKHYVRCAQCQTSYTFSESDFEGNGRRLECSVCGHSWYQTRDRLLSIQDDFELIELPERDLIRIKKNIEEGKSPKFVGDKKLYVGNISFECHEDDIYKVFTSIGDVGDVTFVRDETGRCRGFGFVTMRTEADATKCVEQLDGMSIRGRNLQVRESNN